MDNNAKYYKKISTTEFTNGKLAIKETIENSTEHKIGISSRGVGVDLVCIKDIEVVKEFFFTEEEVEKVKKFFYDTIKNKKLYIERFAYNLIKNIDKRLLEDDKSIKYIQSLNYYQEILQDSHTFKRYRLTYPPSTLSFYCRLSQAKFLAIEAISIYKDEEDWFLFQINLKNPLLHNQLFRCDGFLGLKKMIENLPL